MKFSPTILFITLCCVLTLLFGSALAVDLTVIDTVYDANHFTPPTIDHPIPQDEDSSGDYDSADLVSDDDSISEAPIIEGNIANEAAASSPPVLQMKALINGLIEEIHHRSLTPPQDTTSPLQPKRNRKHTWGGRDLERHHSVY